MTKWLPVFAILAAMGLLLACNKQKPPKLNYTEEFQTGNYDPHGLPGENFVGTPPSDSKYTGYENKTAPEPVPQPGAQPSPEGPKPPEKQPENQPENR